MGEYKFGVTGKERKALAVAIGEILDTKAEYLGVKGEYAYRIGDYTLDREGTVIGEFNLRLFAALENRGFDYESSKTFHFLTPRGTLLIQERFDTAGEAEAAGYGIYFTHNDHDVYIKPSGNGEHCKHFALVGAPFEKLEAATPEAPAEPENSEDIVSIEIPLKGFTPETLDNLCKMVTAKEPLIKKALGVDALPIRILEDSVVFPWFNSSHNENMMAYAQFITALATTAKEKKRVTAKAQETFENEKFTLRVWLIGLGLIGKEYGLIRKLMTANLSGNGAWRYGKPEAVTEAASAPETAEVTPDTATNEGERGDI